MTCCQCQGIEKLFNDKAAARDLKNYRKNGPDKTTRVLIEAIKQLDVSGRSLLDIGGGVGAIQHELIAAGIGQATDVDASIAYMKAAQSEAERRGHRDKVAYHHGNFVDLAPEIAPADIVTLDRVICCYHDMQGLVSLSAERARRLYGVVYPRDVWWARAGMAVFNIILRLVGNPFRTFVHPTTEVEAIIKASGLERRFYQTEGFWQVAVYGKGA